jgi:hypothetical protein
MSRGPEIEVGDESFDEAVESRGEATSVLAVLDGKTREMVRKNVTIEGTTIADDSVLWHASEEITDERQLEKIVRDLLALAERLRDQDAEIPDRLARNVAKDPVDGVRLANLRTLQSEFPDAKLTRNVSQSALEDEAPVVRLAAADFLGEPGLPTLRDLVLGDPIIDAGVRSEALRLLLERAPQQTVLPVLIRLLGSEDADAAVAAASALGRVGTVAAVAPLRATIDGALTSSELKHVAREAIKAIQARLMGAESGQLGLAEAPTAQGQLTVSDPSQDGRVSLANSRRPEEEAEHE